MNGIIRSPVDGLAVHMPKHKRENFSAANCYRHHTRGSKLSSSFFLQLFLVCVFVCNLQFAICKTKANHRLPAWKIKQNPCCEMFENGFYVLDWFLCLRMKFHDKLCSPPLHSQQIQTWHHFCIWRVVPYKRFPNKEICNLLWDPLWKLNRFLTGNRHRFHSFGWSSLFQENQQLQGYHWQPDLPLCQCRAVCHPPHTASSILGCSILTGLQGTPPHSPTFMSAFLSPPRSPLNREDDWEEGSYCSAQHGNAYYIAFNTSIQLTYFF